MVRMTLRSSGRPAPDPHSSAIASRVCQSFAASSRESEASVSGSSRPGAGWAGAAVSNTVQAIVRVPSGASSSSTTRDCCGQSMWLAVVTCQKPISPSGRHTGVTR